MIGATGVFTEALALGRTQSASHVMAARTPLLPITQQHITADASIQVHTEHNAAGVLHIEPYSYEACEHAAHSPSYALHSIANLWRKGHKTAAEIAAEPAAAAPFYKSQNELLEAFRTAVEHHPNLQDSDQRFLAALAHCGVQNSAAATASAAIAHDTAVRRAVVLSNVANAFLLAAQIFAFSTSRSLAVLACFLDAVLDFVAGLLIFFTWSLRRRRDKHRYPVGRQRLEPLGSLGMACLMTAATIVTLEESIGVLVGGEHSAQFAGVSLPVACVILSALITKLSLYAYCGRVHDPAVRSLCEDHRNDVLSNATSLITAVAAQHLCWWLDPAGGIFISCLVIRNWVLHTVEKCDQLLGKAADTRTQQVICFTVLNHSAELKFVDTVRAYHVGSGIFAEVDIVLNRNMPLHMAHDIGEDLQIRIEQLDGVERCFVHLDTEAEHSPSTEHKEL